MSDKQKRQAEQLSAKGLLTYKLQDRGPLGRLRRRRLTIPSQRRHHHAHAGPTARSHQALGI